MLYSQAFIMPNNGTFRVGTIGGDVYTDDPEKGRQVLGYNAAPRYGLILVKSIDNNTNIYDCRVQINGYSDNLISNIKCPCNTLIELPCSVVVTGPAGASLLIEAWPLVGMGTRGANQSFSGVQAGIPIPIWADTVDFTGTTAIFRNNLGAIVGSIDLGANNNSMTGFSIPTGAATVDIAGSTAANTTIIFRQV